MTLFSDLAKKKELLIPKWFDYLLHSKMRNLVSAF